MYFHFYKTHDQTLGIKLIKEATSESRFVHPKTLRQNFSVRHLQSVLIFAILNHPRSFLVCYYLSSASLHKKTIFFKVSPCLQVILYNDKNHTQYRNVVSKNQECKLTTVQCFLKSSQLFSLLWFFHFRYLSFEVDIM